ncbi:hypothetical protein ANCCAN_03908 [Ancylostoma caninum]|uniref:Uncharacterized protein n=1 Tax=Ancylostoma caninum TaxID=29170 RepID=A0A368H4A8_ANCCA|nr:hypothetical protein ANCCAN_03908 [Ancylostoma caninum]
MGKEGVLKAIVGVVLLLIVLATFGISIAVLVEVVNINNKSNNNVNPVNPLNPGRILLI